MTVTAPAPAVITAAPVAHAWRRALAAAGLVWLAGHVGYLAVTMVSRMADPGWIGLRSALGTWQQSDTHWYLIIAAEGYGPGDGNGWSVAERGDERVTAFFPLYPMLIRVADPVLPGGALVAALAVSNAALFGALAVLHRLVEHEFDEPTARRAIWYLMLFPTAFFLVAGYPTSLFLLLVAGAVYAVRREHWWTAGLLGGFATATRQSALLLVAVFGYEYLRRHGRHVRWDAAAVLLVPAGLLAYMAHLAHVRGDPLAFLTAQNSWLRTAAPPWDGPYRAVLAFRRLPLVTNQNNTLELLTVLLLVTLLGLSLAGPWRLRRDQWVLPLFGAALLLFYLCYPTTKPFQPLMSISRFALEVFPAFALLARLGRSAAVDRTWTFLALEVQAVLLVHFLHGGWVA
ncbi:hypothetical protein GCM10009558_067940 [Virgisporangium aurantiacum]